MSSPELADLGTAALLNSDAEPSDDTPTIISKTSRRNERAEDGFAVTLRGRRLAHFELVEPIGVGGMAAVIRARDLQLDRFVALKILPPEMASDPENVRRFHQEARAAAKLDHENIARVFFCGEDQGLYFIAFEFVEGANLRTILERRGRLPVAEAINYMLQVATGLAHASSRGVVHRDIKPSNIIISPNGRAKLVDMGLARSLEPRSDGALTQSGVTLGTFDYISPEQALEPREADVRSDIYSLGCTFYHMLTGLPPVPEGTAAKKLHHHQHVAPVDPRQLNSAIPDDVALILSRMMSKDPKDRYQRPEHLVQHLLLVAQKVGAGADIPEGVLFVDAPLLNPPRMRPMLVGLGATAAVVALVALLGWLPGPSSPPEAFTQAPGNGGSESPAHSAPLTPNPPDNGKPRETPRELTPTQPAQRHVAHNLKEMADLLKQKVDRIVLASDLDIRRDPDTKQLPRLVVENGSDLTIEAEDPINPVTIRLSYDSLEPGIQRWAAFTAKEGSQVRFRGLHFVLNANATGIPMAAIAKESGSRVTVERCDFKQEDLPPSSSRWLCDIVAQGHADTLDLILNQCCFKGGQTAVLVSGPGYVQATNCAFGPYATVFRLQETQRSTTTLGLRHCSTMLEGAASVFRLEDGASCRLLVGHCLFSRPRSGAEDTGDAFLIHQNGDNPADPTYDGQGQRNVYHNLAKLWVRESPVQSVAIERLDEFRKSGGWVIGEEDALALTGNPWCADRPQDLLPVNLQQAFAVRLDLAELRVRKTPSKAVVGVNQCVWGRSYEELPPLPERKPEAIARKEKIVDPMSEGDPGTGIYKTLAQAAAFAQPGDVILIRHNGLLSVDSVSLAKAATDLTIRPDKGCKPILTLGDAPDRDAAIFRLHDGQLKLENLEFVLPPPLPAEAVMPGFDGQSIVMMLGDGQCLLKECVVTLKEPRQIPLACVAIADTARIRKMMEPSTREQVPRVRLERCFIRGEADLVAVRASRRFELDVEDSLVVLDGSLMVVSGNPGDPATRPPAIVRLKRTLAYLADHLLWLQACKDETKNIKGLVQTQVLEPADCLFAAHRGKSLIRLDGIDTEEQTKSSLAWKDGRHNAYSGFAHLVEQHSREGEMALPPQDKDQWSAREPDALFVTRARLTTPPNVDRPFHKALPADFKFKATDGDPKSEDLQDHGANLDRLPLPADEGDGTSRRAEK